MTFVKQISRLKVVALTAKRATLVDEFTGERYELKVKDTIDVTHRVEVNGPPLLIEHLIAGLKWVGFQDESQRLQ